MRVNYFHSGQVERTRDSWVYYSRGLEFDSLGAKKGWPLEILPGLSLSGPCGISRGARKLARIIKKKNIKKTKRRSVTSKSLRKLN